MIDANGQELQVGDLVIHANWSDTAAKKTRYAFVELTLFRVTGPASAEYHVQTEVVWGKRHSAHKGAHHHKYLYKFPVHLEPTRENVIAFRRLLGLEV